MNNSKTQNAKRKTQNGRQEARNTRSPTFYVSRFTFNGFTLIELLVAVSIIGILVSLLLASFTIVQQQARNTQRKNDLKQYQTALENYASANSSLYPNTTASSGPDRASTVLCGKLKPATGTQFISDCPEDTRNTNDNTFVYQYQSDSTTAGATATKWALWAKIEGTTNNFWVVCSDGRTKEFSPTGNASVSLSTACP